MSSKSHKATKQQQRDRARRRAQRLEKADQARAAERRRTLQALLVGAIVLALVGAVVALSMVLGDRDDDAGAAATPTGAGDALDCSTPPAAPGDRATHGLPDPSEADGNTYTAMVTTNCGDITFELDGAASPQTVASFVNLADEGFYDDSPCHRLLASGNTVLQCGDPTGTGTGGPGYGYGIEFVPEDGTYPRGTLAMARTSDLESGTGGQFFIVASDSIWPPEGGGYTIFGNVTSGMEIIDQIVAAGVAGGGADGPPAQPISILSIAVTEK